VLPLRTRFVLRERRLERVDQVAARLARLDHLVDVAALGRRVRIGERLSVLGDQLGPARLGVIRLRELVRFARQQGYRRDELIQLIEEIA